MEEISRKKVEQLRVILSSQYGKDVSFEQAEHTGRLLLSFYGQLAQNKLGLGKPKSDKMKVDST